MRADRLLAILMQLQSRGRCSARQLAAELEVSQRTIYRDIDALSTAGVPVYAQRGPEGGFALLDSFRTDLTGLTAPQLRALFMLRVPSPLVELGVADDLRAALLKLAAAQPAWQQGDGAGAQQRIYLDFGRREQGQEAAGNLTDLYRAVCEDRRVTIRCRTPFGTWTDRTVDPYSLVASDGTWYLLAHQHARIGVIRLTEIAAVQIGAERFRRTEGFSPEVFWVDWSAQRRRFARRYPVTVRVSPAALSLWAGRWGNAAQRSATESITTDEGGWSTLTLPFESLTEHARDQLLPLGGGVEVLYPEALRLSMLDHGLQIAGRYSGGTHIIESEVPQTDNISAEEQTL